MLQDDTGVATACGCCHDCAREVFDAACAKFQPVDAAVAGSQKVFAIHAEHAWTPGLRQAVAPAGSSSLAGLTRAAPPLASTSIINPVE